jgi:glucokinase
MFATHLDDGSRVDDHTLRRRPGVKTVIGIDLGGTYIKAGVVDESGEVHHTGRWPSSESCATAEGVAQTLADIIASLRPHGDAVAVGIGIAGLVDSRRGVVRESPNFPTWSNLRLVERLAEQGVGLPIAIDNDAHTIALGEAEAGSAQGYDSFLLLTLGTGVGGAIVLDGDVWRGRDGFAGELGHIVVQPEGHRCGCGGRGCLEQYASLQGLRHFVAANAIDIDGAEELLRSPDLGARLATRARAGDPAAIECFQQLGYWLGLGLSGLLNALNVGRVVLSGGIARALPLFEHAMLESIARQAFPAIFEGVTFAPGALGDDGGVLGAGVLASRHLERR